MSAEVRTQPFFLLRALLASAYLVAFAVEHDDVPRPQVIAVVAFLWITRIRTEIVEVWRGAVGMKFVVSYRRKRSVFVASPGGLLAIPEFLRGAAFVSVVACGEYDAWNRVEKLRCGFSARQILASGNVTSSHENWHSACNGSRINRSCQRGTLRRLFHALFASTHRSPGDQE